MCGWFAISAAIFACRSISGERHPTARVGYKSRPHEEIWTQHASSDSPVVVMEATEYGDGLDAAVCLDPTWNRLLVPEGLVRT